ncbi:MAG TPA: cyclic pyranopterin monophosphate synthase MoaC [Dehalococcoidia bacterium]|nr:cyclic pyranopterin monophosphate synthase MoaC [Dehalococcoidia bacterium]
MIDIYTDGSCSDNPGPGGWAAIVVQDGRQVELKGSVEGTTSNRMELTAAINGLAHVPEGSEVSIHSDSEYLVNTMTRNWKRRANLDLWHRLDELTAARKVKWVWVEGHSGHPGNERADRLAVEMSACTGRMPRRQGEGPTHFDSSGQVYMVDVSEKQITQRAAVAKGAVKMNPSTLELIERGQAAKGDVLAVAQMAGIMAAKRTSELIPLCHPLRLAGVAVEFQLDRERSVVEITATVKASERTGLEMEALTAVAVSALTIYDMCKAVDRGMKIEGIRLVKKTGGKSGTITLE